MAAPYWGQLPAPKVTRQNSASRDGPPNGGENLSINTQVDRHSVQNRPQVQSGQNRSSTLTEAPTVSTQSPFASPTASSFRGNGLAPRPPSFPYGAGDTYKNDYLDKRRRRQSRNREQMEAEVASVPPPAAPDAPRPPPVSYKELHSYSAPSTKLQAPVRSGSSRRSEGPLSASKAAPGDYDQSIARQEYPDVAQSRQNAAGRSSKGKVVVRDTSVEQSREKPLGLDTSGVDASQSQSRKGSTAESEAQRRREWAPDRSPLQRLELTLDSITKEEKRARVEEAELLAREARAGRGGERAAQTSVHFRNRPVAKRAAIASQPEPQSLPEAGLVRNLSNKQKDQLQRSGTVEKKRPVLSDDPPLSASGRGFDYEPTQEPIDAQKSEKVPTPQHGASLRGLSAAPVAAGVAAAVGTTALVRSGSNKLKKDPPGDPWFNRRAEAERKFPEVLPRNPSLSREAATLTGGPSKGTAFGSHPQINKELPMPPRELRGTTIAEPDSAEEIDPKPVRHGSLRKIEQLTGAKAPGQDQRQTGKDIGNELATVNGVRYAVGAAGDSEESEMHHGSQNHRRLSDVLHWGKHDNVPSEGVYVPARRLDEWRKGGVALLSGELLDLEIKNQTEADDDKTWWEAGHTGKRRRSSTKQRKAEAYDGEYDDSKTPTRFKPPLFLKCGPLLRYCGLRRERLQGRYARNATRPEREIWRGSVMIVTHDGTSSYELEPTLRLFLQPIDLLPPPPAQVNGEIDDLAPEYVDPIAGLPKIGRDGRTLYVRPVDHLPEETDLSREESDEGLFELHKSPLDNFSPKGKDATADAKASASRSEKSQYDGEKAGKYKEVRGFRLHTERGVTFWRFNVEVELRDKQQRIAYRINRGPATAFWVPARGQAMNIMFHSCNGFSLSVNPNQFSGPDPMWRDVLNTHQTQPFHVMIGGGDQIYNDAVMEQTTLFKQWLAIKNQHHKDNEPLTPELQDELETFYLNRYSMWFSQGLFSLANSQIPMVNVFDDHDIIDGFGSYTDHYMSSPIMSGLGAIAFKYYMLFQHQSSIDEGEDTESSWILGSRPGPYIPELSRSVFMRLGQTIAFLGLDCRTERMFDEVVTAETYEKVFDRLKKDVIKGETKHLIVLLGIPIAYPRLVWLETILTSRLMEPVKALGRAGVLGKGLLNRFDGGVEVLDDLDDHWTAKNHKEERNWLIQELQDLASEKSVRVTILGGDVHLAAIGQFYSNPRLGIPKDRDHRYMPNIISSAIVNTPPPDMIADVLNKRNKVHHLDRETDEDMIPVFTHDVNGKPRNNKRLLNRRNWCSIREYNPELTPPGTPQTPSDERSASPPPRLGLFRRLSTSRKQSYRADPPSPSDEGNASRRGMLRRLSTSRGPSFIADVAPPVSNAAFFARRLSTNRRASADSERPGTLTRTLSLSRKDFLPGNLFSRKSKRRPDDGGINGYGAESDDDLSQSSLPQNGRMGIRGGSGGDGDDYFSSRAPAGRGQDNSITPASVPVASGALQAPVQRGQFHRTPTGLSEKQKKMGAGHTVNLEGGLDICLNMEVSQSDPAGITTPYRLLVPALWYGSHDDEGEGVKRKESGLKRWVSFRRNKRDAEDSQSERE